jgi:tight adherence protein C
MIAVVVVLAFVATVLGVAALMSLLIPTANPHAVRLEQIAAARSVGSSESTTDVRPNRFAAWLQGVAESLGRTMPVRDATVQSKRRTFLAQGGYRHANAVVVFQGCRLLLAAVLPGVFLLILPYLKGWDGTQQLAVILLLGVGGFFIPHLWLMQRTKLRREEISNALPNALDLMVVCVEAGLGLDATIHRLAQEQQFTKQALSDEFQIVTQEVRAGKPRSEALTALKNRVGIAEMTSLVVVLLQAERLGTGVGRALRIHADALRTKRRQLAEERAAKVPVKMVFPMVLLIFPAMLLVVLGPAWIQIYKAFGGMK